MPDEDVVIELKDGDELKSGADAGAGAGTEGGDGAGTGAATGTETGKPDALGTDLVELQRKLDESERRRIDAEQRANQATQRASAAETTVHSSQMAVIMGALDTIEANAATLEAQMAEALAAGDFVKHSQLNRQLVEQAAQKVELQKGKTALEAQAKQPRQLQPTQLDDNAKVDLYVQNMLPRAAAWIRAHPDYVTDTRKNAKLLSRHHDALANGIVEGSDDYFKHIETGLGLTTGAAAAAPAANGADHDAGGGATTETPLSTAAAATQRRDVQPSPAAPSRGGGGTRTIKLTPSQQEAARMSGLSNEEYARNMVREQQAGNIGKTRVH